MAPIVAAIASMFVDKGLNLLAKTVEAGGEKAVDMIEKKTGLDIKDIADPETETKLEPEHIEKLKAFEVSKVLDLAKIVAGADANKAGGIIVAAIAPEIPEMVLFGMGLVLVLGFALAGQYAMAGDISKVWIGGIIMYVKGK